MRRQVGRRKLRRDFSHHQRNDAGADFRRAEGAQRQGIETKLERVAFDQRVVQIGILQLFRSAGFVIDDPKLLTGKFRRIVLREERINPAAKLELDIGVDADRTVAADRILGRHPLPGPHAGNFGAEMPGEITRIQPARRPPIRNRFA